MPRPAYTSTDKFLHWTIVALIAAQLAFGWLMPDARRTVPPDALNNWHMSFGIAIVAVMMVRLARRLVVGAPLPVPNLPRWQERAADAAHWALYFLVFAVVLSGWANATTHNWPIKLWWSVPLPALFPSGAGWARDFGELHTDLMVVLLVVAGLHIAAALAHHFILRDSVLCRMLPGGPGA